MLQQQLRCGKALQDVTEDEFRTFMDLLQGLSVFNGEGSKELVEIIAKQADLDSDFKVRILPYFDTFITS